MVCHENQFVSTENVFLLLEMFNTTINNIMSISTANLQIMMVPKLQRGSDVFISSFLLLVHVFL